ncbi:hypothetical protein SK128_022712 [Halocaridina rubra]|uniref:Uncharacterized protein n=1 Tax=Halocaridina rubra TaxID=373956 RepID=A0AAN9AFS6_HALRR
MCRQLPHRRPVCTTDPKAEDIKEEEANQISFSQVQQFDLRLTICCLNFITKVTAREVTVVD